MNLRSCYGKSTALLLLTFVISLNTMAQRVAVKTNLLYDATLTPNVGIELGMGRKHTLQGFYSLNLWKKPLGDHRQWKHWQAGLEYHWWPCSKFNGHFVGVHAMGGEFNFAALKHFKLPFYNWPSDLNTMRYEGWNAGVGVTYGYQWILSRHWNLEASIGAGYQYIYYKKYPCAECGSKLEDGHKHYFGFDKLALSVLYVF